MNVFIWVPVHSCSHSSKTGDETGGGGIWALALVFVVQTVQGTHRNERAVVKKKKKKRNVLQLTLKSCRLHSWCHGSSLALLKWRCTWIPLSKTVSVMTFLPVVQLFPVNDDQFLLFLDEVVQGCVQGCMRAPASLSPSTLLVLLQLPQLPLLALTLPDELPESEPDSQTPLRLSTVHFRRVRAGYTPAGYH